MRRSALAGQVIDSIKSKIAQGMWPVGVRLPREAELAAQFGVSRITLRQAVQALVHVGLLETIQGSGTFVRATSELDAVLRRYLAGENLTAVVEVRLAIETEAASLAARRRTDADMIVLEEIVATSRRALMAREVERLADLSIRFHQAVVMASQNAVLQHFYGALHEGTERSIREDADVDSFARFVDEHACLLEAIRAHNADAALELARAHLLPLISGGAG